MNRISEHISWKEATYSYTAKKLGISNIPNEEELKNMKFLADNIFEPLRKWYGKAIYIHSFFRCRALNEKISKSKNSQHIFGQAIDIDVQEDNFKLFDYIRLNLEFDQLIAEDIDNLGNIGWIHVSYVEGEGTNRKQCKVMIDGKYYPYDHAYRFKAIDYL